MGREPEGELPRPPALGSCEVSDHAGTPYRNETSSSAYGMVRVTQRTFVPSPSAGTDAVELRFRPPSTGPGIRQSAGLTDWRWSSV
jgi:hypothetical protein